MIYNRGNKYKPSEVSWELVCDSATVVINEEGDDDFSDEFYDDMYNSIKNLINFLGL